MGRPTLLTDLVAQQIVSAVRLGATREGAAKSARVGRATLLEWLQRGRDGEQPYDVLVDRVREAEGELEITMMTEQVKLAKDSEHPPTKLKAIEGVLARLRREGAPTKPGASNDVARDPLSDLSVVESVANALRSRQVA